MNQFSNPNVEETVHFLNITDRITLDFSSKEQSAVLHTKQNDRHSRFVECTLMHQKKPFAVPNGASAQILFRKPDRNLVCNPAEILENRIVFELTPQMLAFAGVGRAEIWLMNGQQMLSSATFSVLIETSACDLKEIESSSEFQTLVGALQKLMQITEESEMLLGRLNEVFEKLAEMEQLTVQMQQAISDSTTVTTDSQKATKESQQATASAIAAIQQLNQQLGEWEQRLNAQIGKTETAANSAQTAAKLANDAADRADRFSELTVSQQNWLERIDGQDRLADGLASISQPNTVAGALKSLRIFGNTEAVQKNLCQVESFEQTALGFTLKQDGGQQFTLHGTAEKAGTFPTIQQLPVKFREGDRYYLQVNYLSGTVNKDQVRILLEADNGESLLSQRNFAAIYLSSDAAKKEQRAELTVNQVDAEQGKNLRLWIWVAAAEVQANSLKFEVRILSDRVSAAAPVQLFGVGASGTLGVSCLGRNLWNLAGQKFPTSLQGMTVDYHPKQQSYTLNGTIGKKTFLIDPREHPMYFRVLAGECYTLSVKVLSGSSTAAQDIAVVAEFFDDQKLSFAPRANIDCNLGGNLTEAARQIEITEEVAEKTRWLGLGFYLRNVGAVLKDYKLQIQFERAPEASTWNQTNCQTAAIPVDRPLYSLPSGISDCIQRRESDGKWGILRRVSAIVADGEQIACNWLNPPPSNPGAELYQINLVKQSGVIVPETETDLYCNEFQFQGNRVHEDYTGFQSTSNGVICLYLPRSELDEMTVEAANNWLKSHPVKLYYQQQEEFEELDSDTQKALNALSSQQGETNLILSEAAPVEVTFYNHIRTVAEGIADRLTALLEEADRGEKNQ